MSFICNNGPTHRHETVNESKACWFPPVTPEPAYAHAPGVEPITARQSKFIEDLDGDLTYAAKLSKTEASAYIKSLLAREKVTVAAPAPVVIPAAPAPRRRPMQDPRLKMVESMLAHISDGYYATAPDGAGGHVDFIRISRPVKGRFRGCIKIQTQHSDLWRNRLVRWPSGYWEVDQASVIDALLLVIADAKTCARRYSIELQHCQKCNKKLTDDRSRHYLIGPDCESQGNESVIEEVDLINDGMTYEQLVRRGMPTRVWQETAV